MLLADLSLAIFNNSSTLYSLKEYSIVNTAFFTALGNAPKPLYLPIKYDGFEIPQYKNSVKADIFGFDIADVSGSIRLFSDVMKRLGIKLDGDELYEEFQRIYDKSVDRDADKEKTGDKIWNNGRGR